LGINTVFISGIITTPLICMGIIIVFHFRDYYYPPISGIILPPQPGMYTKSAMFNNWIQENSMSSGSSDLVSQVNFWTIFVINFLTKGYLK
jgi:hypothetical protein